MNPFSGAKSEPVDLLPAGIRALTMQQPWASLIADGHKDVENRGWATTYRGSLLIHAGQGFDPAGTLRAAEAGLSIDQLPAGAFVALCHLEDIVTDSESTWAIPGHYYWKLTAVTRLADPVPARGAQRLWTPDVADLTKIGRQLGSTAQGKSGARALV